MSPALRPGSDARLQSDSRTSGVVDGTKYSCRRRRSDVSNRLSDLTPELQEYMEDYIQQYVLHHRVVYRWFDVYDLEEERL